MNGPLMLDLQAEVLALEETRLIQDERVGGIILFSRNYSSPSQLEKLCASIRHIREELIIAVDQEGGRVQRFEKGFTKLPAVAELSQLASTKNMDAIEVARQMGWLMATEVRAVGVDISFAPVLDLNTGNSKIIGDRAFAGDPETVVKLAGAYIEGMNQAGMAACGKHFPGHGAVIADSHLELPIDSRSRQQLMLDIFPFEELAPVLSGMMPAHVLYTKVDETNPAGFSSIWVKDILRKQLKFDGVIFSDDLSMEGAAAFGNYSERASKAMNAGCDMVLICNNPEAVKQVLATDVLNLNNLPNASKSAERIKRLRNPDNALAYTALKLNRDWQQAQKLLS